MREKEVKEVTKDSSIPQLYKYMGTMEAMLDEDPLQFGPKRLNNKIATLRNMLTELERIFLRSSKQLAELKKELRLSETKLALTKANLFATDPEVRSGRSVSDREATAAVKMAALISEKLKVECNVCELTDLMLVIKAKRSDLRDIQSRLRDQIKLCHDEIALGSNWGRKTPTIKLVPQGNNTPSPWGDLDNILDSLEDDFNLGVKSDWKEKPKGLPETAEEALPKSSTVDAVEEFLAKGMQKAQALSTGSLETDDDFDSIFSNL